MSDFRKKGAMEFIQRPALIAADFHQTTLTYFLNTSTLKTIAVMMDARMTDSERHDHDEGSHLSEIDLRVRALESLLVEKGYIDPEALDQLIDTYENKIGPQNGAKVIARAWFDPDYKRRLLKDATAAIAEMGFQGRQGEHMVVKENTTTTHNLVVCTLCSCYPWPVLGLPPVWYKSAPYRSRAVIDPRGVLADFGVSLAENTRVDIWDSTAEIRYLVLPMQPKGSENWSEEQLRGLVTRDSMIGTGMAIGTGLAHEPESNST